MNTTLTLSECIRIARRRAELDQDQLAARVGVSRQLVSKWERGKSIPDIVQTARLAHATQTPVAWFTDVIDLTDGSEQGEPRTAWFSRRSDDLYHQAELFNDHSEPYDLRDLVPEEDLDTLRSPSLACVA